MAETELERLAKQLGSHREDVRRLLDIAARSPDGTRIARNLLRAKIRQAGMAPDDPSAFPMVTELPPGRFRIGHVINGDAEGPVLALPEGNRSDIQHTAIAGRTRYGKSWLLLSICRQHISAGGCCWMIDPEGEFPVLVHTLAEPFKPLVLAPRHLRINFFQPPADAVPWKTWLEDICLLFRQELYLRDGSINLFDMELRRLIEGKGLVGGRPQFPSLAATLEHFKNLKFGGGKIRSNTWLESLVNRIGMLCNVFEETSRVRHSDMLTQLAGRSVIFYLRGLRGLPLQFLVHYLVTWLARHREGDDRTIPFMVVLDEYHLFSADPARVDIGKPTLCTQVATAGKRNIRFVLSNQLLNFPDEILGNVDCKIVMRLSSSRCLWTAQRSMGLTPEQAANMPELGFREAIVQYGDHPAPFKVRVDELSFPKPPDGAELELQAQDFLAGVRWAEEAIVHEPSEDLSITGDALKLFIHMAANCAQLIPQRRDAVAMEPAQEVRARSVLEDKGFVTELEQTLGNRRKFHELTPKGIEWATRHKIKVKQYKSGPLHEYLLNQVEKKLCALSSKFAVQRNSSIAREHGLEPDSVLLMPEGRRVIIEICCSDMPYEARNLTQERLVDGVDMVLAVTPNRKTKKALEQAVEKCQVPDEEAILKPLIVIDAGECLAADFDWVTILERPT